MKNFIRSLSLSRYGCRAESIDRFCSITQIDPTNVRQQDESRSACRTHVHLDIGGLRHCCGAVRSSFSRPGTRLQTANGYTSARLPRCCIAPTALVSSTAVSASVSASGTLSRNAPARLTEIRAWTRSRDPSRNLCFLPRNVPVLSRRRSPSLPLLSSSSFSSFFLFFFCVLFSRVSRSVGDEGRAYELSAEIAPFYPDADQSLENADSYPERRSLERTKSALERSLGRPDISREACRIASRDKMSDSSSRKRKREMWIKGQNGHKRGRTRARAARAARRRRWTRENKGAVEAGADSESFGTVDRFNWLSRSGLGLMASNNES